MYLTASHMPNYICHHLLYAYTPFPVWLAHGFPSSVVCLSIRLSVWAIGRVRDLMAHRTGPQQEWLIHRTPEHAAWFFHLRCVPWRLSRTYKRNTKYLWGQRALGSVELAGHGDLTSLSSVVLGHGVNPRTHTCQASVPLLSYTYSCGFQPSF